MADIRPFAACRPAPGLEAEIAALPYDVYSRAEARAYVADHPGSFLAIDRAETTLPQDIDIYDERVYRRAGELLQDWIMRARFVQDGTPCYYLYAQTMGGRTQTGIVACASIDDYDNNVIKKHENTRADKEQDRICHVDACSAQTGPIFLCYRPDPVIEKIVRKTKASKPVCDFLSEGEVRNQVWIISDPDEKILIVSHGCTLGFLQAMIMGFEFEDLSKARFSGRSGSISKFILGSDGRVTANYINFRL